MEDVLLETLTPDEKIIENDILDDIVVDDMMSIASDITKTVSFLWNNYHFLCLTTLFFFATSCSIFVEKTGRFQYNEFFACVYE